MSAIIRPERQGGRACVFAVHFAAGSGITREFEAPEEAFVAPERQPGYPAGVRGTIHDHPLFREVET